MRGRNGRGEEEDQGVERDLRDFLEGRWQHARLERGARVIS